MLPETKIETKVSEEEMGAALELCQRIASFLRSRSYAVQLLGETEEVAQIGAIGVMKAAAGFDRSRGVKFATFASARIRGEILDAARNISFVRVPRSAIAKGEPIVPVDSLERIRAFHQDDSGNDSGWMPSVEPGGNLDAEYAVDRFLRTLNRTERSIVRLYFGLGSGLPLNMRTVGQLHGLSESRISQMMTGIISRAQASPHFAALNRTG